MLRGRGREHAELRNVPAWRILTQLKSGSVQVLFAEIDCIFLLIHREDIPYLFNSNQIKESYAALVSQEIKFIQSPKCSVGVSFYGNIWWKTRKYKV